MKSLFQSAAIVALALSAGPGWADDAPAKGSDPLAPEAVEVLESLTLERMSAILIEAGAEDVKPGKNPNILTFKSGARSYIVVLSECDETGKNCALATIGRAIKAKLPLEVLNKVNDRYSGLVSASRIDENTIALFHAAIVGGGVTANNIAINMVWYVNETPQFEEFIKSQLVASTPSTTQQVSADLSLGDAPMSLGAIANLTKALHLPKKTEQMKLK